MSNHGDQQHISNGLMVWLTTQFGAMQRSLGELHAQQTGNRQTVIQVYHQLTHRMDRIEDRLGYRRFGWMKHVPWFKIILLSMVTVLIATGHLTVAELKAYLIKRLAD